MKSFYVTTTEINSDHVRDEILRVDRDALVSRRPDNRTLFLVQTARMSELTLEAIDGVAHAVSLAAIGKKVS